jgi:AraC-like DNA-binding protein
MAVPQPYSISNLRHPTRLACGMIPLLNMLESRGVDSQDFLDHAGIRKVELIDPAFTITFEQELKLTSKALDSFPEPTASLELARHYHFHNFSVLGLAVRACQNLGDVFNLVMRYPRLVWGICETSGSIDEGSICFELKAGHTREERFLLERDMACIKTLFGDELHCQLDIQEVKFSHNSKGAVESYEDFFRCPVLFGPDVSSLTFPAENLNQKIATADPLSKEFYEAQCARLSAEIDEPFRFSHLVRDRLSCSTPVPDLEELAKQLEMDTRAVQRELKKEGTTFSHQLRDVRLKRATDRLLYSSMKTEDIAQELGFNDAVAFSHAFKQWTGVSPRHWLNQQKPEQRGAS